MLYEQLSIYLQVSELVRITTIHNVHYAPTREHIHACSYPP